jgi:methylated-DNA-[protein]-cysteine S-methyltransferase
MEQFIYLYDSPLGRLRIVADEGRIHQLGFLAPAAPEPDRPFGTSPAITLCCKELDDYFSGRGRTFTVPLALEGSPFRLRVWEELQHIPYGKTISYRQLARRLGDVKCIRAAGSANGRNPVAIIVPCHRVIGSNGSLVGYAGGMERKKWLLEHENRHAHGVRELGL